MAEWIERADYRVVYPLGARPVLRMRACEALVADVSENGFRILLPADWIPRIGDVVAGELHLVSGGSVEIEGRILRVVVPHAAGRLLRGIPFRDILEEQRWLLRNFLARP